MSTDYKQLAKYLQLLKQFPKRKRGLSIGDSWFQYPLRLYPDLQRRIALDFRKKILFLDDSYPGRDANEVPDQILPRLTRIARHLHEELDKPFDLFLLSLGGNDVIGRDFELHLKRATDAPDGNEWEWHDQIPEVVRRHIKLKALSDAFDDIRGAYDGVIAMRNAHAPGAHLLCHTYADVTPTNKPYEFIGFKSGPWLLKPMKSVGLTKKTDQRELSRWLLESFKNLLERIAATTPRMTVLDTRLELPDFDEWWDNEIHPLGKGFALLAKKHWKPAIQGLL